MSLSRQPSTSNVEREVAYDTTRARFRRGLRLAGFWTTMGVIWLILLPWLSKLSSLEKQMRDLDALGVNPSALYYSELEMMPRTILKLQLLHQHDEGQFWGRPTAKPYSREHPITTGNTQRQSPEK